MHTLKLTKLNYINVQFDQKSSSLDYSGILSCQKGSRVRWGWEEEAGGGGMLWDSYRAGWTRFIAGLTVIHPLIPIRWFDCTDPIHLGFFQVFKDSLRFSHSWSSAAPTRNGIDSVPIQKSNEDDGFQLDFNDPGFLRDSGDSGDSLKRSEREDGKREGKRGKEEGREEGRENLSRILPSGNSITQSGNSIDSSSQDFRGDSFGILGILYGAKRRDTSRRDVPPTWNQNRIKFGWNSVRLNGNKIQLSWNWITDGDTKEQTDENREQEQGKEEGEESWQRGQRINHVHLQVTWHVTSTLPDETRIPSGRKLFLLSSFYYI